MATTIFREAETATETEGGFCRCWPMVGGTVHTHTHNLSQTTIVWPCFGGSASALLLNLQIDVWARSEMEISGFKLDSRTVVIIKYPYQLWISLLANLSSIFCYFIRKDKRKDFQEMWEMRKTKFKVTLVLPAVGQWLEPASFRINRGPSTIAMFSLTVSNRTWPCRLL